MKSKVLLVFALVLLLALSVYYYSAVYLPSVQQADAINTQIEGSR